MATRSRALDLIRRGLVSVDGVAAAKPAVGVGVHQMITVAAGAVQYVSRGAEKLIAALDAFGFDPAGCLALDVGASTGGFTDVLLARGAVRVYAVDVGRDQLHERLRADERVVSLEATDARNLSCAIIPEPVTALVADVSFIALAKALPAALALAAPGCWLVTLVKPQFEAGRASIGKGGIVRDPAVHGRVVDDVRAWLTTSGWRVVGCIPSPIAGGDGNREFLVGAIRQ